MSEGQIKKMVADGTRDKVYSRKDAGGILESLISKYVSKDQDLDFGALQGKPFSTVVRDFWEKLNTVDKEKRRGMAERFADYVLKCSTMKEVFENSENAKLSAAVGFLDSYLTRVDLQDIRNELQKRYGEDTSVFIRWGKRRHTKDVVMI